MSLNTTQWDLKYSEKVLIFIIDLQAAVNIIYHVSLVGGGVLPRLCNSFQTDSHLQVRPMMVNNI